MSRTTTTTTTGIPSHSKTSTSSRPWKDIPYRLCTICIGVPLLWYLWCHDTLRVLSFYVIHTLCGLEYIYVMTVPSSSSSSSSVDVSATTAAAPVIHNNNSTSNTNTTNNNTSQQPHSQYSLRHRHLFIIVSWILLFLPIQYFVPGFVVTMALVSIILITITLFVQQQQQSSSLSSEPNQMNHSPSSAAAPSIIYDYIHIMIIWFQGIVFITIPFRSWMAVTSATTSTSIMTGFQPTISLLLTVWNCDTGALIFGRCFGRRYHPQDNKKHQKTRMTVPSIRQYLYYISPSKSLEGLIGGVLCGTITYAYLLPIVWHYVQYYHIPIGATALTANTQDHLGENNSYYVGTATATILMNDIGIGLLLSIGAVMGDILESILKRYHHCKDSGSLLPGHGGIYDRFDSSLIAVVLYHYLVLSSGNKNVHNDCSIILNRGY